KGNHLFAVLDRRMPQIDIDRVGDGIGLLFLRRKVAQEVTPSGFADEDQAVYLSETMLVAPLLQQVARRFERIVPVEEAGGAWKAAGDLQSLFKLLVKLDHVRLEVFQRLFQRGHALFAGRQGMYGQVAVVIVAVAAEDPQFGLAVPLGEGAYDRFH